MICKNCKFVFEGNFCNNCGQSSETHKLNLHFIWHDIQHGLFHFDKGIFYSLKELYSRPGHSIREFIQGKRVNHFKPVSMVVVLATLYGLLYHSFEINLFSSGEKDIPHLNLDINHWVAKHYSWLTIVMLPIYTLGTYVAFRNQGYNYVEYFVLNTFKASQRLFLHILIFPLLYYYNGTQSLHTLVLCLYIIDVALIYWVNFQFFERLNGFEVLVRSIFSHLIFVSSLFVVLILIYSVFY